MHEIYRVEKDISGHSVIFAWEDPTQLDELSRQDMESMFIASFLLQYRTHDVMHHAMDGEIKDYLTDYFVTFIQPRFSHDDAHYFLCARSEGKMIGFIFWEELSDNQAYVAELAVAPEYWRHGLGKIFMDSFSAKMPHTQKVLLITQIENKGARKFYEALGYSPSSYMHEGYSPEKYCAYELVVNNKLLP